MEIQMESRPFWEGWEYTIDKYWLPNLLRISWARNVKETESSHSSVSTCIVWIKSCLVRALINWNELFWKSQTYLCPKTWIAFAWIIKLAFWTVLELEFPSLSLGHCFLIIRKHLERHCFHSPIFFSLSSKFTFMCQAQQGIPRWFPRRVHR